VIQGLIFHLQLLCLFQWKQTKFFDMALPKITDYSGA